MSSDDEVKYKCETNPQWRTFAGEMRKGKIIKKIHFTILMLGLSISLAPECLATDFQNAFQSLSDPAQLIVASIGMGFGWTIIFCIARMGSAFSPPVDWNYFFSRWTILTFLSFICMGLARACTPTGVLG